jgi:hypothetical protein
VLSVSQRGSKYLANKATELKQSSLKIVAVDGTESDGKAAS